MKLKSSLLKTLTMIALCLFINACNNSTEPSDETTGVIIDHNDTDLSLLKTESITKARESLHIAYGHTSHGSQLISGMQGLTAMKGSAYAFNHGGSEDCLDLRDRPFSGANDLGNPNRTQWAASTRTYLAANPDINVIIWSWCGQVSSATEADIETYLDLMNGLENDYPGVKFVYMTGHLDGSGEDGNLHKRNEQIRRYCVDNQKVLYDFADIESYDPSGEVNYMLLNADDACNYDSDGDGSRDANWATAWQQSHTENVDWFSCGSAHSQPLNANLKAYAAWALWTKLAE